MYDQNGNFPFQLNIKFMGVLRSTVLNLGAFGDVLQEDISPTQVHFAQPLSDFNRVSVNGSSC